MNKEKISEVVENYFNKNNLENFMNYGADSDAYILTSFSDVYKELLKDLGINYKEINTNYVSDGKYETVISINNGKMFFLYTSAWNGKEVTKVNLEKFIDEYKNYKGE